MHYGVALAAIYSHPAADLKAGAREVNSRFGMAESRIPYYNIGRHSLERERERAARLLHILNKNVTKEIMEAGDGKRA